METHITSSKTNSWPVLGQYAYRRTPLLALSGSALVIAAGLLLGHAGPGLSRDDQLLLVLIALIIEGLFAYDFFLRNIILRTVASIPAPASPVRQAYRHHQCIALLILVAATTGTCLMANPRTTEAAAPLFIISLPLLIGLPIFGAGLGWLCRSLATTGSQSKVGRMLGRDILPADVAPAIYGLAVLYGILGSYALICYFSHRIWSETGNIVPLIVVVATGVASAIAALVWFDKKGVGNLLAAAPRLHFLDRQGLLLATPYQEASRSITQSGGYSYPWLAVRVQALRQAPLLPVLCGILGVWLVAAAPEHQWKLVFGAIIFGLVLDIPAMWIRQRLVTSQLSHYLMPSATSSNPVPAALGSGRLNGPALLIQILIGAALCAGCLWNQSSWAVAALAGGVFGLASILGGHIGPRLFAESWIRVRIALLAGLVILTVRWGGHPLW